MWPLTNAALRRSPHLGCISPQVRHGLVHDTFNELTAAFDFSHQHGALDRRQAEVGKMVLADIGTLMTASVLEPINR
jgi:hypothetical protein